MDLLTQLSDEHSDLLVHITALQTAASQRDPEALVVSLATARPALTAALDEHIALEEERVFPAVAATIGEGLVDPFVTEHREIRALRDDVFAQADAGAISPSLCLHLCELILEHQQREDLMLFPSARTALDSAAS